MHVLIFGDSMTKVLKKTDFQHPAKIKSWGGAKIRTPISNQIQTMIPGQDLRKIVIIHMGTNNIAGRNPATRQSADIFIKHLEKLLDDIHDNRNISLILSSILPSRHGLFQKEITEANAVIKSLATKYGKNVKHCGSYRGFLQKNFSGQFIVNNPLFRDEVHLNKKGGLILANTLKIAIRHAHFL